jgi:hypothetical protein
MRRLVVSFPKSGRTWLRYGLHIAGHPEVSFTHDGFEYNNGKKPAMNFDPDRRIAAYGRHDRIVYIERDPRDTIVSLFHQVTGRFDDFFSYKSDLSSFIRDPYFGVQNLVKFQRMWRGLKDRLPVLIVTYEDMSADYMSVFKSVVTHLDLQISNDLMANLGDQTSFSTMKDVERARSFDRPWLQPRMGAMKVRRGKVGGYLDELSPQDIAYIEDTIARFVD